MIITAKIPELFTILFLIFAVPFNFLTHNNIYSQWMSVENGSSGNIYEIKFKDENTGWYIADLSLLYKTTNGGLNWKGIDFTNIDSVKALGNFINNGDTLLLTASYNDKRFLKSFNGGDNWLSFIPNPNWKINNIKKINPKLIFGTTYSGQNVFLVRSSDFGNTWDSVPGTYPGFSYSRYSFVNDSTGFVLERGNVYNTSNGGRNWNIIYSDSNQLDNIFFIDRNIGFLVKNIGYLFRTSNGGLNWDSIGTYGYTDILFENINTGYLIRDFPISVVYKTSDRGISWTEKYRFVVTPPNSVREFKDLEKINNTIYIAAFAGSGIFKSTDGGENWYDASIYPWSFDFGTLDFSNANTGFIGGYRSGIRQTTNAGINWFENQGFKAAAIIYRRNIFKIQFINENTGWALTDTGFYKTTNAGNNWNYHNAIIYPRIHYGNFYFANKDIGYFIGSNDPEGYARVFKTTDGGETYFSQYAILNQIVDDLKFYDSLYGYVSIGNILGGPNLIRTTNGGLSWQEYNLGSILGYYKIDILDRNIAYVAERGVFKTTNGGETWTDLQNLYLSALAIKFINANTGFITSGGVTNHNLYTTSNGGVNWRYSNIGSNPPLWGIYLNNFNKGLGFVFGNSNKIYRTDNFGGIVGVSNNSENIPYNFILHQSYPNPFNPKTIINYELPITSYISLRVYDVLGKEVIELVNKKQYSGRYSIKWNASNFSSGIYFYSLFVNNNLIATKKMLLIK